jgi:hypothetical protein
LNDLERETGTEPATFSLANPHQNNEHSISRHLVLAMKIRQNVKLGSLRMRMEHKWSTSASQLNNNHQHDLDD